ncbi:5-oxoprolinase subunit PxpB [Pseudoalteromonas sp. SSDWG2]|uniref:5-oxoprolinase subunit PxpB n=1 Tax=Pseudoalteromonas sp. SSDWG2 TaxID=3139391 RepID=UPI003BA8B5C2
MKPSKLPSPDVYVIDDTTLVIDCFGITELTHKHKQRLINYVAGMCYALDDVIDAVSADESLTLYTRQECDVAQLQQCALAQWHAFEDDDLNTQHHVIPVEYGGSVGLDLETVAEQCNMSTAQVIEAHCSVTYDVDFLGFQPGFAYMSGVIKSIQLPRLAQPRTQVPKGSVAIAADKTAVYPANSPGGWHIIGSTHVRLFDINRTPASLLRPGDTVRFVEAK